MCGRFALIVDASVLAEVFEADFPRNLKPRFNIAPTQTIPIVRLADEEERECAMVRWGLVPSWAKDEKIGARMINARGETIAEKPSFRSAVKRRRCLIPATGFFEWVRTGSGKQPHFVHFTDARPFAFAGLWERWQKSESGSIDTCTIITTTPNQMISKLHHRMPVILPTENFSEWIQPEPLAAARLQELLVPHPSHGMEAYPVTTHVNRPANDDPKCIVRMSPPT